MSVEYSPVLDFLMADQNVENDIDLDWNMARDTLKCMRVKFLPSEQEYNIIGLSENNCNEQMTTIRDKTSGEKIEMTVSEYFENEKNITLQYSGDYPCININLKRPFYLPIELCKVVKRNMLTTLIVGDKDGVSPCNGSRNFDNKEFGAPVQITNWACVNFSSSCNTEAFISNLMRYAKLKGMNIDDPLCVIEEDDEFVDKPANIRVDQMFNEINSVVPESSLTFILCILSKRKKNDVYGAWKKKNLFESGIVTQCITTKAVNDEDLTNILMKINAKLGGLNYLVDIEYHSQEMILVTKVPTMIIGMYVWPSSQCQSSDIPPLAAVVGSREWPLISKYKACVRTQPPEEEMIGSLFKLDSDKDEDEGIFRELLLDFISTSEQRSPPTHIIIFREGVSESQFQQVLDIELDQIMKACEHYDMNWNPKFTVVVVARKSHYPNFFQKIGSSNNVPQGTLIIDGLICHPSNYVFNLSASAQEGKMIGSTDLIYYHILKDEISFSPNELQKLVHSLSYNFQRSTKPISIVSPIKYAHLAAIQMATAMKSMDNFHNSEMPPLHDNIASTMFFC